MFDTLRALFARFFNWLFGAEKSAASEQSQPQITPPPATLSPAQPTLQPGQPQLELASTEPPKYAQYNSLFSYRERVFYRALVDDIGTQYRIFAKVRLGDIFYLANEPENRKQHNNQIQCKHFDFVLCDNVEFRPLLVIELDDSTHNRIDHRERDEFKNQLCENAGLPIWRVNVQRTYPNGIIATEVKNRLANSIITGNETNLA